MMLEEMRKILVQTNLEKGLLEKGSLDGLVKLEVYVFPNNVSESR